MRTSAFFFWFERSGVREITLFVPFATEIDVYLTIFKDG